MNVRAKNKMPTDTMPHITSAVQPAKNSFRLSAMLTIMGFSGKRVKEKIFYVPTTRSFRFSTAVRFALKACITASARSGLLCLSFASM